MGHDQKLVLLSILGTVTAIGGTLVLAYVLGPRTPFRWTTYRDVLDELEDEPAPKPREFSPRTWAVGIGDRVVWGSVIGRVEEFSPSGQITTLRCDDGTVCLVGTATLTVLERARASA